jgi:osmotically-inducible protein OsmY
MQTDAVIRDNVMAELEFDPSITHTAIGVTVSNGVVTLSGHVPSYAQKVAAERATQRVKGVRAVAQDLEVRLPFQVKHDDEEIASRAASILSWSVGRIAQLKAVVENGWVTLSGRTDWQYQRKDAERAVRALAGVQGVSNNIIVQPRLQPSEIKTRIAEALRRNAEFESEAIKIVVEGSRVTLSGKVKAWYERKIAEDAAWAAPGVSEVRDDISLQ